MTPGSHGCQHVVGLLERFPQGLEGKQGGPLASFTRKFAWSGDLICGGRMGLAEGTRGRET